jgi:hypothetical protein
MFAASVIFMTPILLQAGQAQPHLLGQSQVCTGPSAAGRGVSLQMFGQTQVWTCATGWGWTMQMFGQTQGWTWASGAV